MPQKLKGSMNYLLRHKERFVVEEAAGSSVLEELAEFEQQKEDYGSLSLYQNWEGPSSPNVT